MGLKGSIKQLSYSKYLFFRLIYRLLKVIWFGMKLIGDGRLRSETFAGKFFEKGKGVHQRVTFTMHNRYPLIFTNCADYFLSRNITNPSILSFGCSTGEEVNTIGEYLPNAKIIGVDINEWCIRQCLKANRSPNYTFLNRRSKEFKNTKQFDAIFCMAVFQRTENKMECNNQIARGHTFEQFEMGISVLDDKLNIGGLLIIDHSDFRFTDSVYVLRYKPLEFDKNRMIRKRPLYNKNNRKVADEQYNYRVFVKQC
jgi:hypothetical protein